MLQCDYERSSDNACDGDYGVRLVEGFQQSFSETNRTKNIWSPGDSICKSGVLHTYRHSAQTQCLITQLTTHENSYSLSPLG